MPRAHKQYLFQKEYLSFESRESKESISLQFASPERGMRGRNI